MKRDSRSQRIEIGGQKASLWTEKGFTLLEVMVAVAILSLGLVIVIQSFSISLRAAETSLNLSKAALLAQRKLSEVELENFSFESLDSGDFGEDYPGFSWETEIIPIEVKEEDIWQKAEEDEETAEVLPEVDLEDTPFLYQATITIFWQERGDRRNLKFATYLARR